MHKEQEKQNTPWWGNIEPTSAPAKTQIKRPYAVIAGFFVIIFAMIFSILNLPDPNMPKSSSFNSTQYPADSLETIAGCGPTFVFDVPKDKSGKIPENFFDNPYGEGNIKRTVPLNPMLVPAYGYYQTDQTEPTKTFWEHDGSTKKIQELPQSTEYLSYMWDGWTIIWYSTDSEKEVKDALKTYASTKDKVMVMPWVRDDERNIPLGRNIAMASWGISRSCELWSTEIADRFISSAKNNQESRNEEPYEAKLDSSGELPLIEIKQSR